MRLPGRLLVLGSVLLAACIEVPSAPDTDDSMIRVEWASAAPLPAYIEDALLVVEQPGKPTLRWPLTIAVDRMRVSGSVSVAPGAVTYWAEAFDADSAIVFRTLPREENLEAGEIHESNLVLVCVSAVCDGSGATLAPTMLVPLPESEPNDTRELAAEVSAFSYAERLWHAMNGRVANASDVDWWRLGGVEGGEFDVSSLTLDATTAPTVSAWRVSGSEVTLLATSSGCGNGVHCLSFGSTGAGDIYLRVGGDGSATGRYTLQAVRSTALALTFSDDFDGDLSNWVARGGAGGWQTSGGELTGDYDISCGSSGCPQAQLLPVAAHQPSGTRWRIEATFSYAHNPYSPSYDLHNSYGTFILYVSEDEKDGIGVGVGRNGEPLPASLTTIEWAHSRFPWAYVAAGIADVPAWDPFAWNTIALERDGDNYRFYFRGALMYEFTMAYSAAPAVGVSIYGKGRYGSFRIYQGP